ncbi:MAG: hypothetical protein WCO42_07340 [bacterium]
MKNRQPRLFPHRTLRSLFVYTLVSLCLLSAAAWALTVISEKIIDERQAELVTELRGNVADSPAFLAERLFDMQLEAVQLFVPGMTKPVSFSAGLFSFDPKAFPESFVNGLVYDPEHGSPVYHLRLREVQATREIEVLNADVKVFYVFKPRADYDPHWIARRLHPEIYLANCAPQKKAANEDWLDPSHVEMTIDLIPDDYVEVYAEETVASLLDVLLVYSSQSTLSPTFAKASLSGGMSMMRMAGADTNIVFSQIGWVGTGMLFRVDYPDTQTNRLEMMACTNLVEWRWWLVETNLVTAGTNSLMWVDTSATNVAGIARRFYRVGSSEDSDGDGLANGREALIYHTDPFVLDSDGDGLVDGYSGVVTTNAYPGGVATNGNLYVEGELSWGTDPTKFDTDGDGMGDGWEVAHGHNPLDPNDPPNVSGTVSYSGRQTGTVWVIAVTASNSWSTTHCYTSTATGFPVSYLIPDLEETNYWIKSWLDSNGNGQTNAAEAQGIFTNIQTVITNRLTGGDISLGDPDNNSDGLPDWWEIAYFGNATNNYGGVDSDGDEYTNLEEYDADTDPTNNLSHPWNVNGTITYTGLQTGTIYVVACTNGTDWTWVHADTTTNFGTYSITHLPPNANYWVRAWRDSNGDGLPTSWEAWGGHDSNPVFLDANLTGQDVVLADPDNDGDGFVDWWEILYGLDPTRGGSDGLTAWWKLNESSGTNAVDSTANANNGILYGFPTNAWVAGVISNSLHFDGTNSYVEVPDSVSLKSESINIGLWITPDRLYTNGTATFVSKQIPGGTTGYNLGYDNGALAFTICKSGALTLRYACALTSHVPVHVMGTYSSGNQQIYVNGVPVAQTNYIFGMEIGGIENGTNSLKLGAASGGTLTNLFAGTLDDVRIGPGSWASNDVAAIYQIGADPDHDGLSTWQEYQLGINPKVADTDGDGVADGAEISLWGTNPNNPDSDGDLFPDGWEIQYGYNPAVAQAWNWKEGKLIITSPVGQWDWTYFCNKVVYNCQIGAMSTVSKPVSGVVWSDAITNVLLIVGDRYGDRLRRFNTPVVNRQFTYNVPLLPGDNKIQAYSGCEASNVFYYMGTDNLLMQLSVDMVPTNTLRMEFDSTIEPVLEKRPIFDVVIQQRTHSGFSTPHSWTMQRPEMDYYPTASWAYPYGTWNGSTRGVNISPISGMIRVDVHDVSQDHATHDNTLRVLMNGQVMNEEVRTGLSNYLTNDWRQYDTAMKGGVWVYHNRLCGGFTVNGDKNLSLLPQMTFVGYSYQPAIDGISFGDSIFRGSNGVIMTDTTYPYSWYGMTNMTLSGPNGSSPVFLKYGESAQFCATGTVMLNTPGSGVTTNFPGLNIVNCFSGADEFGVLVGKKPGYTNILCTGSSSTIDVYVAGSPVAVNVQAAMDGNQDRVIDFANTNDSRCLFWINDDHDTIHIDDYQYVEDDTDVRSAGAPGRNCDDNTIGAHSNIGGNPPSPQNNNCRRDLEDFTVLQLKVSSTVTNLTGVTYWLKIVPESGSPVINVFRAVTNGVTAPFDYLTKTNVADFQIKETKLYEVGATEQQLNTSDIKPGQTISYLIEGKSVGKGDLTFVLKKDGAEWTSDRIKLDLRTITNFYDIYQCWRIDPTNKVKWEAEVSATSVQVQTNTAYMADASKYLLFVHGWNMSPQEKRSFAETAFKRLWWQGYKGGFGLYDWPTLWGCNPSCWGVVTSPLETAHHYDDSEMVAWLSATALAHLMETINTSGQLRLWAHSMGNIVAGEALRKYSSANKLKAYVASQAAISSGAYNQSAERISFNLLLISDFYGPSTPPLFEYWSSGDSTSQDTSYLISNTGKVDRLCNYYNRSDMALSWWIANNKQKPDDILSYSFAYGGSTGLYVEATAPTNRFYRWSEPDYGFGVLSETNLNERYAVFAYDLESRTIPLGLSTNSVFKYTNRDLKALLNYDDQHYSHSRQYRSNIVDEKKYYDSLMNDGNL